MKKNLLMCAVMLCIAVTGWAQDRKMEQTVLDRQNEFVNAIQNSIENQEKSRLGKIGSEWQQFLLEYSKTKTFLNFKDDTLSLVLFKPVYSKMIRPKNNIVAKEVYVANVGISRTDEVKNKKGEIISYLYTTDNEVGIVSVKNDTLYSNAKYHVKIDWNVKWSKKKVDTTYIASIADINCYEMTYLAKEKQQMARTAEKLISQWYDDLSTGTFDSYNPISFSVLPGEIEVAIPEIPAVTVSEVPAIRVNVNPEQYMTEDRSLYLEPVEAYYILKPTFKVRLNEDFASGTIVGIDYEKTLYKPETAAELSEKYAKQGKFIQNYVSELMAYAANRSDSLRNNILGMFADDDASVVEVSNVAAGVEKIYARTVSQYLTRLKTASMKIELGRPVVGPALESIIYPVSQQFESAAYSDYTEKEIHLLYDHEVAGYVIDKVLVVKGSTRLLSK